MTLKLRYLAGAFGLMGLTLVSFFLSVDSRPAHALTNCTVLSLTLDAEEIRFAELINQYRQANGKPRLTVSVNLNRMASWHAKDMADKNYFSHTDSLGRSPSTRGTQCEAPSGVGENIAAGNSRDTAQEAFDAWKASSGHNQNMLNGSYKQIGIARHFNSASTYDYYWVTDFSLNSDGTDMLGSGGLSPSTATATRTRTATPSGSHSTATRTPTRTPTRTVTSSAITRTPTPGSSLNTATRTPTRTSTPAASYMHVGDLEASASRTFFGWSANAVVLVENATGSPVGGATVSATWSNGATGSASCVTASTGRCTLSKSGISSYSSSVTFTVTNVIHASLAYRSSANDDLDLDSNGTSIVVRRP